MATLDAATLTSLAQDIRAWGQELGFQALRVTDTDLTQEEALLGQWLARGFHGDMDYMQRHGTKRTRPAELVPGTVRIISVRLDYRPPAARESWGVIADPEAAFISRYALGRDYHKVMRAKLQALADRIETAVGTFRYRVFTDSAPVMEVALAAKAGLGWRGKHTLLLTREAGSWYFLGELYTDLPLPVDQPVTEHCGTCSACIDICPTQAIVAPYQLDARRCISYLTIEHPGSIPEPLRAALGNRIYGCDDCQLVCPWNKFAQDASDPDFKVRHALDATTLLRIFAWDVAEFNTRFEGSAIRRIGFERWQRNLAVALGNALASGKVSDRAKTEIRIALQARRDSATELVCEHIDWALRQTRATP